MKRILWGVLLVFLLVGTNLNVFAADLNGDNLYITGNVGIGTTPNAGKLHVQAANGDGNGVAFIENTLADWGNGLYIKAGGNTDDLRYSLKVENAVGTPQLFVQAKTGNVGIGTTDPQNYKLYVAGTAYFTGESQTSDIRFKENIASIETPLNKILNIEGVTYNWKHEEYKDKGFPEGRHYGVIAQEIEKVLPEVVTTAPNGEKAVAYNELIPVLIEAVKQQQKIIEELKSEINSLKIYNK